MCAANTIFLHSVLIKKVNDKSLSRGRKIIIALRIRFIKVGTKYKINNNNENLAFLYITCNTQDIILQSIFFCTTDDIRLFTYVIYLFDCEWVQIATFNWINSCKHIGKCSILLLCLKLLINQWHILGIRVLGFFLLFLTYHWKYWRFL